MTKLIRSDGGPELRTPAKTRRTFGSDLTNDAGNRTPRSENKSSKKVGLKSAPVNGASFKKHVSAFQLTKDTLSNSSTRQKASNYDYTVHFDPGPIGIKLEPVVETNGTEVGCRVRQFVDGGERNPGQARMSARVRSGDLIVGIDGRNVLSWNYPDVIHLLKRPAAPSGRNITFRTPIETKRPTALSAPEEEDDVVTEESPANVTDDTVTDISSNSVTTMGSLGLVQSPSETILISHKLPVSKPKRVKRDFVKRASDRSKESADDDNTEVDTDRSASESYFEESIQTETALSPSKVKELSSSPFQKTQEDDGGEETSRSMISSVYKSVAPAAGVVAAGSLKLTSSLTSAVATKLGETMVGHTSRDFQQAVRLKADLLTELSQAKLTIEAKNQERKKLEHSLRAGNEAKTKLEKDLEAAKVRIAERDEDLASLHLDHQNEVHHLREELERKETLLKESEIRNGHWSQKVTETRRDKEEALRVSQDRESELLTKIKEQREESRELLHRVAELEESASQQTQTIEELRREKEEELRTSRARETEILNEGKKRREQNRELESKVVELESRASAASQSVLATQHELDATKKSLQEAVESTNTKSSTITELQTDLSVSKAEIDSLKTKLLLETNGTHGLHSTISTLQESLAFAKSEVERLSKLLKSSEQQSLSDATDLATVREMLAARDRQLEVANSRLQGSEKLQAELRSSHESEDNLLQEVRKKEDKILRLEHQVSDLQSKQTEHLATIEELIALAESRRREVEQSLENHATTQAALDEAHKKAKTFKDDARRWEETASKLDVEAKTARQLGDNMESRLNDLTAQLSDRELEVATLMMDSMKKDATDQELCELETQVGKLKEEVARLESACKDWKVQSQERQEAITKLQDERKACFRDNSDLVIQVKQARATTAQKENEIASLKEEMSKQRAEVNSMKHGFLEKLKTTTETSCAAKREATSMKERLQETTTALSKALDEQRKRASKAESSLQQLMETRVQEFQGLSKELQLEKSKSSETNALRDQLQNASALIKHLKKKKCELDQTVASLEKAKKESDTNVHDLESELDDMTDAMEKLVEINKYHEAQLRRKTKAVAKSESLSKDLANTKQLLEEELDQLRRSLSKSKSESKALETSKGLLENTVENLEMELASQQKIIASLTDMTESLEDGLNQAKNMTVDLESNCKATFKEKDDAIATVKEMKSILERKEADIVQKQDLITKLQREAKEARNSLCQLQEQVNAAACTVATGSNGNASTPISLGGPTLKEKIQAIVSTDDVGGLKNQTHPTAPTISDGSTKNQSPQQHLSPPSSEKISSLTSAADLLICLDESIRRIEVLLLKFWLSRPLEFDAELRGTGVTGRYLESLDLAPLSDSRSPLSALSNELVLIIGRADKDFQEQKMKLQKIKNTALGPNPTKSHTDEVQHSPVVGEAKLLDEKLECLVKELSETKEQLASRSFKVATLEQLIVDLVRERDELRQAVASMKGTLQEAGANLMCQVEQRLNARAIGGAFRDWSKVASTVSAVDGKAQMAEAMVAQLEATRRKLYELKSHFRSKRGKRSMGTRVERLLRRADSEAGDEV